MNFWQEDIQNLKNGENALKVVDDSVTADNKESISDESVALYTAAFNIPKHILCEKINKTTNVRLVLITAM